ncbi:MAG: glycosyltransferase [Acidimicrobiia bacterium]
MRVLISNNYDLELADERHRRGEYPAQHLWGGHALRLAGHRVTFLPLERFRRLRALTAARVGDLDQQLRILLGQGSHDVFVSGTVNDSIALGVLRRLGLYRRPIVAVVHWPLPAGRARRGIVRWAYGGQDRLLFLSQRVRAQFESLGADPARCRKLDWGVDLRFYPADPPPIDIERAPRVIAAGKTDRDYPTLVKAFADLDVPLDVYCSPASAPDPATVPPNVAVHYDGAGAPDEARAVSDQELMARMSAATVVALPTIAPRGTVGLTSLVDAMVMGRPVVMTRNPYIDVDVEGEGIGLVVEPGNVEGWRAAVARLVADPAEAAAMGRRARALCVERYGIDQFERTIVDAVLEVAPGRP